MKPSENDKLWKAHTKHRDAYNAFANGQSDVTHETLAAIGSILEYLDSQAQPTDGGGEGREEAERLVEEWLAESSWRRVGEEAKEQLVVRIASALRAKGEAEQIDPRPTCICCGERWIPDEGVDATVERCDDCKADPSPSAEDDEAWIEQSCHEIVGPLGRAGLGPLHDAEMDLVARQLRKARDRGAEAEREKLCNPDQQSGSLLTQRDRYLSERNHYREKASAAETELEKVRARVTEAREALLRACKRRDDAGSVSTALHEMNNGASSVNLILKEALAPEFRPATEVKANG